MSSGDPFLDALNARVGSADLPGAVSSALPGAVITSGLRSPGQQQALIDRGATTATHSPHVSGNAFDMKPIPGMTAQQALAQLRQNGVNVTQVIDETKPGQGTGPHWHFAGDLGGEMPAVDRPNSRGVAPSPEGGAPDPYLHALDAAIAAPDARVPDQLQPQGAAPGGAGAGADVPGGGSGGPDLRVAPSGGAGGGQPAPQVDQGSTSGDARSWGQTLAGLDPLANYLVNGVPISRSLRDNAAGLLSGAASIPETLMRGAAGVADYVHPGDQAAKDLRSYADKLQGGIDNIAADPTSAMYKSRELGGMVGATLPLGELNLLGATPKLAAALRAAGAAERSGAAIPVGTKLAAALAKYGDMAIQGGAAGALTSRGQNVGESAAIGAALGPVIGKGVETVVPGIQTLLEKTPKLAAALRARFSGAGEAAADAADVAGATAGADASGWTAQDLAQGWRRAPDGNVEFAPAKTIRKGSELSPDDPNAASIGRDGRLRVNITGGVPETAKLADALRKSAPQEMTPAQFVDRYMAGEGRDDPAMLQYAANNGPEIEAEFNRRADQPRPAKPREPWSATLERMVAERGGEATGAINHPEIGPVDVPWGEQGQGPNFKGGYGLAKIIAKHPEVAEDLPRIVEGLPIKQRPDDTGNGQYVLENDTHRAVVAPDWHGDPKQWLVTALEKKAPGGQDAHLGPPEAPDGLSSGTGADATIPPQAPGSKTEALADALKRQAMGSRGQRRGIESNTNWPPEVAAHAQQLVKEGLPLDQALREAEITYVGAKPALAHVTRNPADQRAMWEGAKQDTLEGQQLATQIADNNTKLHQALQTEVGALGGIPAQGEATETAARSLARSADRAREHVQKLYHEAEAASGPVRVFPEELYSVVSNERNMAAVTNEGAAFIRGLRNRVDQLTQDGKRGLTGPELDQLHQHASYAFDPTGPAEINRLIWDAKDAINFHLDQIGEAGPAYKRARLAHQEWARAYENPEGVRKMVARRPDGSFVHEDNWRRAEGSITALADRPFVQVVRQLKATGDTRTLDRLKASIIQQAYEYATGARGGNAVDMLGQSPVSGKMFLAKLDQIGMPKLQALFTPSELGRLATIGRAASHLNEAVPGTVNTSGTASALLNALQKMKGVRESKQGIKSRALDAALLVGGQVAGHALMPGVGGVVMGTAGNVAKGVAETARESAARAAVAEHLREAMNPSLARSSAREATRRLENALRRRSTARTISARTPPVAGSAQQQRRK